MIKLIITAAAVLLLQPQWHLNMSEAQALAKKENRHILLNFSGSDWCGPCIVLRSEVFGAPAFADMADSSLVLVNADFPRMRKDQLSKAQQAANDRLADQYDPKGIFPLTLLLTADGKVVREWQGNPGLKPEEFAAQIRGLIASNEAP